MLIGGRRLVQTSVRDFVANGRGGAPVKQVCGGCKSLSPVLGGHGRMDEHGAHRVIEGTKHTFSFAILWGSVGTGEMEDDAVGSEQVVHGMVNKLRPVISLEASNGRTELCANVWDKISKVLTDLRLVLKWKRPAKMSEIIQ